jgi:hypothetical protein
MSAFFSFLPLQEFGRCATLRNGKETPEDPTGPQAGPCRRITQTRMAVMAKAKKAKKAKKKS